MNEIRETELLRQQFRFPDFYTQLRLLSSGRALAVHPEVLLMDESTSAIDPISTSKIEDLVMELKNHMDYNRGNGACGVQAVVKENNISII